MTITWKILLIAIILTALWVRLAPAAVWLTKAHTRGQEDILYRPEWCKDYKIVYEWSWWSLRFTSIYPVCIR